MRVRSRLVVAVAVVAVAVLGAGAPAITTSSGDLTESQRLVALSELNDQAVSLADSLADERDGMTQYVAAGRRTTGGAAGITESRRARVDRQIAEIRPDAPASLRRKFDALPELRQQALAGPGSAFQTFEAYSETVQALYAVADKLSRQLPPRASGGPGHALPQLGRAVERASATRGLLLSTYASQGREPELSAAAQRHHVQEQAALADFEQTAPGAVKDSYRRTVNGTEIATAERYLARLTDQPRLSPQELTYDLGKLEEALSARVERMRAVNSSLTADESARLAQLRDDDVTALEVQIALVGFCLLLAAGICISAGRSMTRPLAVLRLGSRRVAGDPVAEEPVRFTGRNDEFAEVVGHVNELRETALRLHARTEQLGDDRTRLIAERRRLAGEREDLLQQRDDLTERLGSLQDRVHGSFVNLSLRTLGLVERQLSVIEGLEEQEHDPERLETLFKLDHLATRMRRHGENLLVLAGSEHHGGHTNPVPLLDVLRAGISEIERYERVQIQSLPPHAQVAGFAADAVSHLVAELLENATAFSPPDADVELSGWLLESGEVMLSVQDQGIGMTEERLKELNGRLADPVSHEDEIGSDDALGLGLYVVARLAARHGVRVNLREQKQGGIAAVIVLPKSILPTRPVPSAVSGVSPSVRTSTAGAAPAVNLPGTVAEANSNALPRRMPKQLNSEPPPVTPAAGTTDSTDPEPTGPAAPAERAVSADAADSGESSVPSADAATEPAEAVSAGNLPAEPDLARTAEDDPLVAAAERAVVEADDTPPPTSLGPVAGSAGGSESHARTSDDAPAAGTDRRPDGAAEIHLPHQTQGEARTDTVSADPVAQPTAGAGERPQEPAPQRERITDKGLPKRTPKVVAPKEAPTRRSGGVDAEALRRRLGGFQQGSLKGRREVEAEDADRTRETRTGPLDEGGTVEEARG
ncbi:sensor histidine kinase [Streptomyces meridianus]|uniref:histidine kinase n=1 Tax=Streptomyces meridianus TaxID=2938945 RepID=A0ABT0X0I4_9ACTN|nr:nitrate- and nitrite sensing domain-containing protein [Streptomyces meridianus]MCM2576072.1 nitrate- and nitrite sensing domain-containing protein [Streptomyces meridianus]